MKNENLVPKVRFKSFSDPWEQRKLCQIATINPKSVISPHFLYVDLESVSQNRVTQYKAVTKDDAPSRAQRLAKKGDIFFQNVRPYQKNNLLFLTNKNNVVFSTGYTQIRTKQDIRYLFYALQTTPFVNRILALSTGTSYPAISSSKLANVSLLVPIIDEQSKVGLSIFKIDSLIAANEDKLEQLKTLKKLMMQKIFSQEWRFKGFTDPWEQRKLKEITSVIKDGTHGTHIEHYGAYLLSAKNILSNRIVYSKNDRQISINDFNKIYKGYSLNDGDFLLTIVGTIGRTAIYRQSKDKIAFQRSVAIIRGKEEIIDNYFLMFSFQLPTIKKILQRVTSISAQPGIYLRDLSNIEVWYPVISEQQKIIALLKNICNLIAANEDKLNQLKKLKKYLMQNMFV
ncbi:restriction endonuclease subunit S [Lactiplantibacillus plantarum]|uniref:restriction endonuclease subunit S n=1 Tax=Lactiplantibacillus plantarum TaxID=1590 RepID=UPI001017D545|nr:restriction endonuclease subunit S [Lactiplantibacillus plantarum]QBA71935.1 restriction endonuclease subunit S [Lactiplantibacillus plantarum]